MPKMTVRVILKSGVEFSIKCDKFTLTRNGFQQVTGYNIEGITENKPVYLDFEQVAAVVRVFADEKLETDDGPYLCLAVRFLPGHVQADIRRCMP